MRLQLAEHVPDGAPALRVQARRRLVEEEHAGRVQDAARDLEAPPHAAGEVARDLVAALPEADLVEPVLDPLAQRAAREAVHLSLDREVLADGQVLVGRLRLGNRADRAPHGGPVGDDVVALDTGAARGRRQERRQHPDEGRLAGAVGAEQAVDLAGLDGEGHGVVGDEVAEAFGQPLDLDRPGRAHAFGGPLPASTTKVWPETTAPSKGWSRTENVCRSRLWRPQFLRVANSERGLTETIFAWKRASGRACGQTVTRLAEDERGQPLLRNLDTQVRLFDLERHDRLAGLDPLAHPVVARQDRPSRGRVQDALLLEVPDFLDADAQRLLLGIELPLFRLARPDVRGDRVALVLERFQVRRRGDALLHEPPDPPLVRRHRGELGPQLLDLLEARGVARLDLGDLPFDVVRVLGQARLLDARDLLAARDGLALLRDPRGQPAPARERQREALLLGDGQQAQGLAGVVLAAHELSVAPRPGQRDSHRQKDPEGLFHQPQA